MNKTKRVLIFLVLTIFLMIGVTGCMIEPKESKVDKALKYMHEKYDDEFTFKSFSGGDSTSIIFLNSKKFPDADVQVNG